MKVLITGITGLLGSYLAKEFSSLGEIHGLRRPNSNSTLLEKDLQVNWHEGELSDIESLESALEGMDLVIHSAGLVSFDPRDTDALLKVNVTGTTNLVNAMQNTGVKKLIHISSVSAIGRSADQFELDEDFKWVDSPLNTDYAISKYWGELEVWRGQQEGLNILIINPSIILGKISDDRSSTAIYHYVLEENKYFPIGDLNYIDVRDASTVIRLLYEKGLWGERFIVSAGSISYREFFQRMAETFGKKAPSIKASPMMLRFAVIFAGIMRKLGLSKNPLNKKTAMISSQKVSYSNAKVSQTLNYSFRSLEETFSWAK
ncbi:NAD-dependent epimerase/dehydratase family protein [Algoriphagus hitonicola]|uniref:Nucleoside-diphosphate-sugar epimerase n=1 Tax=Algoriphagus hitonicola TaxID=435880 RepID=A0A1I2QJA8_9BACT|nr:NAD-dependent epimerase/dehydratase family protein [Algoriphagus hitonicola]SFG28685.1 Nucleoside-diphosphate-sugar epimerase [Algoriphagus hitonicola]